MVLGPYGPLAIDRRTGSADLFPLLLALGVPVDMTSLAFGDAGFLGRGPGDVPVPVGVERKRLGDLISSLMTGRLNGHQLPGLLRSYQFIWIVIEGNYRVDSEGHIAGLGGQQCRADGLEAWLLTVELRGGVRIARTQDAQHTARWLAALYSWWTAKAWDEHAGHRALHEAIPDHDRIMATRPTLVQRLAAQLPGIGYDRAAKVGRYFPTALSMTCAGLTDWTAIDGIGDGIGRRVVKLLQEGEG